jgi:DNA-binding XRE family transcriptional regulator
MKPIETVEQNGCYFVVSHSPITNGYIQVTINYKAVLLHRLMYEQYHNTIIPDGLVIMHTCDNRNCINPHHLQLGTQLDNVRDMYSKGRGKYTVKDSPKNIRELRKLAGLNQVELAKKVGVTNNAISQIENGLRKGSIETLRKIALALNVSLDDLFE